MGSDCSNPSSSIFLRLEPRRDFFASDPDEAAEPVIVNVLMDESILRYHDFLRSSIDRI
jgi:hypothetical protein